jgi:hypothetical protein
MLDRAGTVIAPLIVKLLNELLLSSTRYNQQFGSAPELLSRLAGSNLKGDISYPGKVFIIFLTPSYKFYDSTSN